MVRYSVLIPQRNAIAAVKQQLPRLCETLDQLVLPYEIICIDDASTQEPAELEALLEDYPPLRVLRFDQPRGTSAALSAGLRAARGNVIVALDPSAHFPARYVSHLIARLSQHDLVVGRSWRSLGQELARPISRLAHLLARSPDVLPTEDLFWAARREAVVGLTMSRGAFRALGDWVIARGLRVCQLTFADGQPARGLTLRPNFARRFMARWLEGGYEPHVASELVRQDTVGPLVNAARLDTLQPRWVPQPVAATAQPKRDSA
jgi:hypothetical protein